MLYKTFSIMESENNRLRRQVVDLHCENTYIRKISEMQDKIISLKQQIIDLKNENTRLSHLVSKSTENNIQNTDNSQICQYCKQNLKYPSSLKRHLKLRKQSGYCITYSK